MRAIICAGVRFPTIKECAEAKKSGIKRVQYALQVTGMLDGLPISYADPDPSWIDTYSQQVIHSQGEPLLRQGYCTHRLGVYHGGRF